MRLPILTVLFLLAAQLCAQGKAQVQLQGTVTDSLSGKPVYDCLVEHYDLEGKRWALTPVNSDGRYAMFIPAEQPFELRIVRENGYRELRRALPGSQPGAKVLKVDLRLMPD